jgi:hypothetical protein
LYSEAGSCVAVHLLPFARRGSAPPALTLAVNGTSRAITIDDPATPLPA